MDMNWVGRGRSLLILLSLVNYVFLPWDNEAYRWITTHSWVNIGAYILIEQALLLAYRRAHVGMVIVHALWTSTVYMGIRIYLPQVLVVAGSYAIPASAFFEAASNAGILVVASNLSSPKLPREFVALGSLALYQIAGSTTLRVVRTDGESPVMALFDGTTSLKHTLLFFFFLSFRAIACIPLNCINIAMTDDWTPRMEILNPGKKFKIDEITTEVEEKGAQVNRPSTRFNLNLTYALTTLAMIFSGVVVALNFLLLAVVAIVGRNITTKKKDPPHD